jgi:hypothetical protein
VLGLANLHAYIQWHAHAQLLTLVTSTNEQEGGHE